MYLSTPLRNFLPEARDVSITINIFFTLTPLCQLKPICSVFIFENSFLACTPCSQTGCILTQNGLHVNLFIVIVVSVKPTKDNVVQPKYPYYDAVIEVIRLMNERLKSPMSASEMAAKASMSERNFRIVFKEMTGSPPREYYSKIRMQKAMDLLQQGDSIAKVAYFVGYSDAFCFSNAFTKHYGFRPSNIASEGEKPENPEK